MSLSFNFTGALDAFTVRSFGLDDAAVVTRTSTLSGITTTDTRVFVGGDFFSVAPDGTTRLEPSTGAFDIEDEAIDLFALDPDFFSFESGDTFTFTSGFIDSDGELVNDNILPFGPFVADFNLVNITVLIIPELSSLALLGAAALPLVARRRRGA